MRVRISCVEVEGRSSSASIGFRPWGVNPSVHQCVSIYFFQCLVDSMVDPYVVYFRFDCFFVFIHLFPSICSP